MFDDNQEPIDNENEEKEEQDKQESQGPNFEQAKDEIKEKIKKEKKVKDAAQKVQKAQKNIESAKKVKAAAQFASGAKKFALLANPYFWIALLVIIAIILLIGIIMSFTIMPSNFLGKSKRFVEEMMQQFCGFVWGDNTSPISNSSEDVKDLANYIQNMGYDIQGYGFGDVEYTKDTQESQEKAKKDSNGIRENSISGKRNYVTDEQATQGGEIKKIYGLTAVTTVSSSKYDDGDEMYRITGRFSSKNNDYLRAYLSAEAATYTEATYSIKGLFNELGSLLKNTLGDIFGFNDKGAWEDPGDVGVKAKSTGMLNFTNANGNNMFNSTIDGSPTKIKIDAKNKKLILYEHALNILGLTSIQWGQTFSIDLSDWTAIYGRPLELFLSLHLSSMMPDLPYQIAVDQAFNTKVNINLEDVKIYFDTTITIDDHSVTIGGDAGGASSLVPSNGNVSGLPPNVQKVYDLLHSKGLTDVQIAAILGNAYRECGGVDNFNWDRQKSMMDEGEDLKLGNVNGSNCTLAGFLPGYGLEYLQQYCSATGQDWSDATAQAEFIYYTLWGEYADKCESEKGGGASQIIWNMNSLSGTNYRTTAQWKNYSGTYPFDSSFKNSNSPKDAAWAYFICYEGMAENEDQAHFCRECAEYWYQRIQNGKSGSGGSGGGSGGSVGAGQKLGDSWRLTAYADNPSDQGQYVGQFAGSDVAGPGVPGKTIAIAQDVMAKYGLQFGDIIRIDGNDYILNDHGGGEMAGKDAIDIFTTEDHEYDEAYNHYTSEVYLVGHNGHSGNVSPVDGGIDLSKYLDGDLARKKKNYEEIKNGGTSFNFIDDDGVSFQATLPSDVAESLKKLAETGISGADIKWPNIESVTNHWYYHIIDFYGTAGEDTPYGAYKKAQVAKKRIKYGDEEGGLNGYDVQLTALLTSESGIYYQVCEPYLNKEPSKYLKTIFHGAYYKYDGTTETARKIAAARAIEAKYGTDDYNDKNFEKDPQAIANKKIKYNWHSTDSSNSKLIVNLEDATEYVSAKKAQVKVNKKSNSLIEKDNNEVEETDHSVDTPDKKDKEEEDKEEGELEFEELGEESPMCKKLVDFKSNKSNTLEAFSILENINSEAAEINYRLLKKLMVEMDYFTEDEMNTHEKNILLWITNVEGIKGADVAATINKNLGQTDNDENKTISDTSRDANEYGVVVSNFMENTQIIAPGDAKVKKVGSDDHGEFIELEFTTLTDDKVYPLEGTMMLLHQDDENDKNYNVETPYEGEPLYSAAEVMRRYRFRETYQVFENDDLVGITMKISGLHNIKAKVGDTVLRGNQIADSPKNATEGEEDSGDKLYVSMKKADKTKIENVEDYINPIYTYEDEKDMSEELWYLDHPEHGNLYGVTPASYAYVQFAREAAAEDDKVGYYQSTRMYKYNEDPNNWDVDCSALVYWSLQETGWNPGQYCGNYPFTTSNEGSVLQSLGFTEHTFTGYEECQSGDILWNSGHTGIYSGSGGENKTIEAHGPTEKVIHRFPGTDYDFVDDAAGHGDQSGHEVSEGTSGSSWEKYYRPPSSDPSGGKNPGSNPSSDPGSNPGSNPGSDSGSRTGASSDNPGHKKIDPEAPSTTGKTLYVAKGGSNSNNGTEKDKPLSSISEGIKKLSPGDKLIIKEGTYHEEVDLDKKGTKEKPITITGSGNVVMDGRGKGGTLLDIEKGSENVVINNITFKNLYGQDATGISIEPKTSHIAITNCDFSNIQCPNQDDEDSAANAIYFEGSGKSEDSAINDVLIKDCNLSKICPGYSEGISIDGNCTNITIDHVTSRADGGHTNIAICVCGNDSETNKNPKVNRPRHVIIKNCDVSGCKSAYEDTSYGIYVDGAYDVTIENNTVTSSEGGIEVGSEHEKDCFKDKETAKVLVKNNIIKNCDWGMYVGGFAEDEDGGCAYDITIINNQILECGSKDSEMVTFDRCNKVTFSGNEVEGKTRARIIYTTSGAKAVSYSNNSYSSGRKASDDNNFGKGDSDYSFSRWTKKMNDTGSKYK